MTKYEYIKNVGIEQLAKFLCEMIDDARPEDQIPCDSCPAYDNCFRGHNGFIEWLKQEKTDD